MLLALGNVPARGADRPWEAPLQARSRLCPQAWVVKP